MYSILLMDDHLESGEVTKSFIGQERFFCVTRVASTIEAAEEMVKYSFNLCIYYLNKIILEELEHIRGIQAIPILFVGQVHTYTMIDKLLHMGVIAFIDKEFSSEQLIRAVRSALDGIAVLPVSLLQQLHHHEGMMDYVPLNNKERSILEWIAEGKSNKELATIFCVSQRTIEYYLTNIFNKFKVSSRLEAVIAAKRRGIINV
ncbi:response regulator transcription factor [Paenibacillus sp. CH40]|uniref:response regulator transcription factor n=1 Tax=Paenibacillus sp. CH40 TaxID=2962045 RepID=UPI0020B741DC|nr:response regulator transcription factor [Paenibacillus sp. CH40]MCP3794593.1 response regulator transcription factor [Paenibacillus sp. CH40]